jgi:hypothetical protein
MLTSPVADAVASFDGGPPQRLPLDLTVEPGPHRVVVQATGYRVAERRIVAVEGKLAAFDVPLDAEPAKLTIATITGAEVHIDGREIASTPLPRPLEVEPGVHLIEVRHRGYVPYAQELELGRGSTTALSLDQPMTHQRTAATVLLVGGGVGVAGGVAMMAAAALRQRRAVKIDEARQSRSISEQERRDYNRALRDRDALVRAGGVAASVGAGIGVTGLLLYFFDDPEAEPVELDGPNRAPGSPQEQPGFEMMLGPGGIGVEGRF